MASVVTTEQRGATVSEKGGAGEQVFAIELRPVPGFPSPLLEAARAEAAGLGLDPRQVTGAARGFLLVGSLDQKIAEDAARQLLAEPVVQSAVVREITAGAEDGNAPERNSPNESGDTASGETGKLLTAVVHVLPRPGVTDPEAESALAALRMLGYPVRAVRTFRSYAVEGMPAGDLRLLLERALANDSIEQVVRGALTAEGFADGRPWTFERVIVPLRDASAERLMEISRTGSLSLTLVEMQTIQAHYRGLKREPTEAELETIAQTWSEHCSHKTLAGRVDYQGPGEQRTFQNLLKETIFAATVAIRQQLGADDWCVSVFRDNAGVVRFDDRHHVTFKVETHNRPSAIEPYGGANTGLGGVIRDTLGTGLGARPVCSTDVFCFAPPGTAWEELPPGVLHPRRIMHRVVAGVRDYGNRMGIPTVNGAIWFDPRYVGNPMVFCGSVGVMPAGCERKGARPGDLIVVLGGRTGRDGIHGATFSSAELHESSVTVSSGAVQIGNAITEKMVADVLLQARERGLYSAVTDCGAGGLSSAVGEMGEEIGAEVWLERAPLKYAGLSATEIWISEAQERMVLAVPEAAWPELERLCAAEDVEATVIGQFQATGELVLRYGGEEVGRLAMEFLHRGRPPVVRSAVWNPPERQRTDGGRLATANPRELLLRLLAHPNIASKHWVIRQYDHEVQGGSVIKPLVGAREDGPSDAAVIRPVLDSNRGVAISCGMNPLLGDLDPGLMAAASIDEAIRNVVATGADPDRIGILDNFCWGYTDRPETLGSLVRAAIACHDTAIGLGTPFISGKDSLNNEFSYTGDDGVRRTITIPCTLLISALGQVPDVHRCVTMDWKAAGNRLFLVGATGPHLGGSHALWLLDQHGRGEAPVVDCERARRTWRAVHQAMQEGLVASCHDCSEGGLAVALAEMAIGGDLGANIRLDDLPVATGSSGDGATGGGPCDAEGGPVPDWFVRLFSESCSRLVCEIAPGGVDRFLELLAGVPVAAVGEVAADPVLRVSAGGGVSFEAGVEELRTAWRSPLDWR